jgi:dCMP deaminase
MSNKRPSWDEFFIKIAEEFATRGTCDRANVGCVIVDKDKRVVSVGYNGSISGLPHCDDVGHYMIDSHCLRTLHSEQNAICSAAKLGNKIDGCMIYTTHFPCWKCFQLLAQSGIKKIIYNVSYRKDEMVIKSAKELGITIRHYLDTE